MASVWASIRSFWKWYDGEFGTGRPDLKLTRPLVPTEVVEPFSEDDLKALVQAAEKRNCITYSHPVSTPIFALSSALQIRRRLLLHLFCNCIYPDFMLQTVSQGICHHIQVVVHLQP